MKIEQLMSVVGAMAVVGLVLLAVQPVSQAQSPAAPATGRFQMTTTPSAPSAGSSYGNFTWVLDTQTGAVLGYRLANVTNDRKESFGWVVERLRTVDAPAP